MPYMVRNYAALLTSGKENRAHERVETGMDEDETYYFVHSYRAPYLPSHISDWAHTTTQYGRELFLSTVHRGNVFACQFHPEKSGKAEYPSFPKRTITISEMDGFTKRIIACMVIRASDDGDLVATKGDQYDARDKEYPRALKIATNTTASVNGTRDRGPSPARKTASRIFVPLMIDGGIKDTVDPDGTPRSALEVAGAYFRAGTDKVSIGSEAVIAVERLLAHGTAMSLSESDRSRVWWYQRTVSGGPESHSLPVTQLVQGVETLGAGEILLNSIDRDGTNQGYDLNLVDIRVHFVDVFERTGVEVELTAGYFMEKK
ncbi:hypothetical protein BS47DRAFT_1360909 [Hydnum rufescens UP504]|uniref:Uncharacterized protein n=1 Tax=Hydnum rufescens UP504 TaxID=1448309 RepID=A0A9P6B285_9AGAM|nr:hypothetical protein BS47DRAFT_1360909 [Hydnum rufescens UP504]